MKFSKCQYLLSVLLLMCMTNAENNISYDKKDILAETGWNAVSVQENAPLHLSVISHGIFNQTNSENYDKNYYYPSSAGEGVDVYVIDVGFNFNEDEFSDVNANCEASITLGNLTKLDSRKKCYNDFYVFDHGTMVSTAIVGKISGVAKKANIHGIVFADIYSDAPNKDYYYMNDLITALEYIKSNNEGNKTIINISNGMKISVEKFNKNKEDNDVNDIFQKAQSLFKEISDNGAVIVAGAGNNGESVFTNGEAFYPCAFESVFCVSGIGNYFSLGITPEDEKDKPYTDEIDSSFYTLGNYILPEIKANYEEVDLYSPFLFHYNGGLHYDNNTASFFGFSETNETVYVENYDSVLPGTSFSTPIVSGIIATLMSEFQELDKTSILKYLTNHVQTIKDIVFYDNTTSSIPFVNNGKKSVYTVNIPSDDEEDITSEVEVEVDDNSDNEEEEIVSADEQ